MNPCKHGGTCVDKVGKKLMMMMMMIIMIMMTIIMMMMKVGKYECVCPRGKTGLLCHLDDQCVIAPCQPGARCDTNKVRKI